MRNFSAVQQHIYANKYVFLLVLVSLFAIKPGATSWNDTSRMGTIQSLVELHTFSIDDTNFTNTGDKVFINGHYYSDKPVMLSILGAVVYYPLYHMGIELGRVDNLAFYLIVLLVIKLSWLAGLYAFYRSLQLCEVRKGSCFLLTFALGFGSLYFTWSSVFNNHLVAASCLIVGYLNILKIRHYQPTGSYFFYAGLFFALAGCIDHATAVFFIGFAIYLFLIKPAERKYLVYYFIPVFITVLPVLIVNFVISGQFLPFQLVPRFFDYEGSTWTNGKSITGSEINDFSFMLDYGFEMLFGQRGFIIYNPLLLIGIPCLVMEIAKGRTYKPEAIVTGVCSLVIMLYYIATSHNYSGGSYSIRWFIPLLPFLMFFIFRYLETHYAAKYRHPLVPVIILSCLISLVGLIDPWASKRHTEHSFFANIMAVVE